MGRTEAVCLAEMGTAVAAMIMTAETAAVVTNRYALVRDRNRPVQDRNRHPVPVRIPGLSRASSRDHLMGMVLPADVKRKETDFAIPV